MGLRNFSMHPNNIADVKHVIADSDVQELSEQVRQLLYSTTHEDFHHALNKLHSLH